MRVKCLIAIGIVAIFVHDAFAAFDVFSGDATQEAAWQIAAGGGVPLENFESFTGSPDTSVSGDALAALPSVHVTFDPIVPGVYDDAQWAHSGTKKWSNWAAGAGGSSSHVMRPDVGLRIYAVGFWNTDPQGEQTMEAYDDNGQLVGIISGLRNTHNSDPANSDGFAGFISTTPIAYVAIPGALGDGANHFDDLQVLTRVVPEPSTWLLALLAFLGINRRRALAA
jgi:hypothetical protein